MSSIGNSSIYNDEEMFNNGFEAEYKEGSQKRRYITIYERNQALRQQAINIHGFSCMVCKFNFHKFYGDWGEGFIHVHHPKPISDSKDQENIKVNPRTDLIVLCAKCHSMVNRKRNNVLTLAQLIDLQSKS